uniref:Leucine rich repeat containing 70 n=1 Tax=Callorhinchus milii TaxID=7868 RepID=A0A4W3JUJ7_CALMI
IMHSKLEYKKMFGYYIIKCCLPKVVSLLGAFLLLLSQGHALDCTLVCQLCTRTQIQCFNLGLISVPRNFPKTITLITLTLNNNHIIHINSGSFKLLRLGYLQLSHNNITSIDSDAFVEMAATLKILHLANNHLSSLRAEVLRPLASLAHLLVSGNPWECNCQLLDLRGWLLSSSLIVSIRCQSPLELCGKALQNINVKEIGRCNTTLAPLALDARERASTTNIVMTSVKLDTQNAAFKVKGSPITFHEFGNENERTEKSCWYANSILVTNPC